MHSTLLEYVSDDMFTLHKVFQTGSYRILTVVFQIFPGQNYFFFRLFEALCSSLCEQRTLQNWLINAEISYTMYSSIPNTKWNSNL